MAGDTENPRAWIEGDVYVATVGATEPTDTTAAWPSGWEPVGLLGEDGLTQSRDEDSNDFYAWGSILVRTVRSKHKRSFKFVALEDNPVVFDLINPGSTATTALGVTSRSVVRPGPNPKAFGFERRDGDSTSRIIVPRGEVTEVGEVVSNEENLTMVEITVTAYPDGTTGEIYSEVTDDPAAEVGALARSSSSSSSSKTAKAS